MPKIDSYYLNLAGEYRVCSELNMRGVFATITYGHRKGADIYALGNSIARRIEVKTSQTNRFVTSITQKKLQTSPDAPHFWVLVLLKPLPNDLYQERFFVLSHTEIVDIQQAINSEYERAYKLKHGTEPDLSKGVDNVGVDNVIQHENQWSKIVAAMAADGPRPDVT